MKDKRTWKIQINLDEFNALCGAAFTEAERSALLGGLQLGCNNGTLPEHCSNIVRTAFEAALGWRQETEGFRLKQSGAGKASAEARKAKFGSANPNAVRTDLEHSSNLTNNQQPSKPTPKKRSHQHHDIPEGLVPRLEALCRDWPGSFVNREGQKQRLPKLTHAQDLWDQMIKFFPKDNPEEMIAAGEKHIAPQKVDEWSFETKPKGFTIAMTNFYGQQARWKEFR